MLSKNLSFVENRRELVDLVRIMFDRKLTNAAGGNIAVRVDKDLILMTPSLMSENDRCRLNLDDLLLIDYDMNIIEGTRRLSREAELHVMLLKNIPSISASIHAHPQFAMVFASKNKPIPSVTEATQKMGGVGLIPYAKNCSKELAQNVYDHIYARKDMLSTTGLAVLLPLHGIVCVGKTLSSAYNYLERVETDAICNIFGKLVE